MGTSDPREFIEAESKRIPLKAALSSPPMARCFQELTFAPNRRLEELVQGVLADNSAKTSNWDSLRIA
jgi:hypothetical protein